MPMTYDRTQSLIVKGRRDGTEHDAPVEPVLLISNHRSDEDEVVNAEELLLLLSLIETLDTFQWSYTANQTDANGDHLQPGHWRAMMSNLYRCVRGHNLALEMGMTPKEDEDE